MTDPNLCNDVNFQCPIQFVVDLLGNKWSILVLRELFTGDRRTNELLKALPGISTKTLMVRLRELETHGLVERRIYAEIPPRVEYSLTAKGREIQPVMTALHQVGSQWLEQDTCVCPLQGEIDSVQSA
ncbi:HxlR family transcriptional regulator [Picosynechococcus sp. PCC 7003]|uniref:winged helix-turn-helix transcriptional regulator n=1 Tax=Picosynechococcus sp. PCC 7003 TaxID=374981 RepID=UPI00081039E6|nr:helix-turn-helix domain-containing protein [Picosynechococcus sp. PCC 7003]ANV84441.1 HxlR family transcriptional regulator [Picosynechococcus sp. PCC 7003]